MSRVSALLENFGSGDQKTMLASYLETALWSSTDDDGEPLDNNHSESDIDKGDIATAKKDIASFVKKAGDALEGLDPKQVGHDFWLTRNGHGAGFWDGDYEEVIGGKLTKISEKFKELSPYVGDDGKIYFA